jgi:hypothetical protein
MSKSQLRFAGVIAAVAGIAIGYWGVGAIARQGFHAIVLPAGLPGILAGIVSRERSPVWAAGYGLLGAGAALCTEWRYRPFRVDSSFDYFLRHLDRVSPMVLAIISIGAVIGAVLSVSFGRGKA